MSFAGKVVVLTGASSGIGAAAAIIFCKEGASVVLVGRNESKLKNVSEKCTKAGGENIIVNADVNNDADAKRAIEQAISNFGKIDILVNNAGTTVSGSILGGDIMDAYDSLIGVNLRAPIYLTSLAAPYIVKTKGNIINISSIAGLLNNEPTSSIYGISKAGLIHFTRTTAYELASSGVRVNVVSPGPTRTDILENSNLGFTWEDTIPHTALKRVLDPEEVGDLIVFLASDRARGITGSNFVIDNGFLIK